MLSQHRRRLLVILVSTCLVLAYFVIRPGYLKEIYQSDHDLSARTALHSLLQPKPETPSPHESPFLTKLHKHLLIECRRPPRWFQFSAKKQIVPAFLISAHDKATIDGAAELLGQLYHPSDVFVLHVDVKVSDSAYADLLSSIPAQCTNIEFVKERVNVGWGDWGIVEMELRMLRVAWDMEQEWDMAFLMDGSTWPLTTRQQRQAWMQKLPVGSSSAASIRLGDMKAVCAAGKPAHYCHRTPARCKDKECLQMTLTPGEALVLFGPQWARLSRQFVQYLLTDPAAAEWIDFFKPTLIPDEHFFPSVLYSSPFNHTATLDIALYDDWNNTYDCHTYPNARPGYSPCYLGSKDLEVLAVSDSIFARKFYAGDPVKQTIIDLAANTTQQSSWKEWFSP